MSPCPNCQSAVPAEARYCPGCGQGQPVRRLTLRDTGHDLVHALFHVDHSVISLVRALLMHPGRVAAEYVDGRRRRYFGPFGFLVVLVAIATAEIALSGFAAVQSDRPNPVGDFLQHHVNLLLFAQVPVLAAWHRLLCVRGRHNYAEHFVLAAYTSGMLVLYYVVVVIPGWYVLRPSPDTARTLYFVTTGVFPVYFAAAGSQFEARGRLAGFLRGLAASLLTRISVTAAVSAVARLFDS